MKNFHRGLAGVIALALLGSLVFRMASGPEAEKRSAQGAANGGSLVAFALATGGLPPNADAGFDQAVAQDTTAVLDASGSSDPEGDALSFAWSFDSMPSGSGATIFDPAAVKPSFQVDLPGDYVARLTATDSFGNSASDTVTVSTGNLAPVADAGPDQTVAPGEVVRLDGSASSDANGDLLGFTWTLTGKPAGSAAVLDLPTALMPSFTADLDGEYMVRLVADDGTLSSAADEVRVSTFDSHPVAEAGPDQKVAVGQTVLVRLEGLFDADGELIEERDWSIVVRPPGSSADFLPNKNRRFIIDAPGSYVVQRMVCEQAGGDDDDDDGVIGNGGSCSGFDTVILTTDANIRPVADAGPDQSVLEAGVTVALRGAGSSDLDGDRLSYRWALTARPMGSMAELDDPAAVNPSFEADQPGSYVAQLIVSDGLEQSRPDTVVITTGNSRPVANAGPDQKRPKKSTITLDGSASSDADGDTLTFDWSLTKRPSASSATLNDPETVNPTFFTDTGRRFIAQLIVRDGEFKSAPDNVVIGPGNMRPVAEAGPDQEVVPGQLVTLDGSGSFDDGDGTPAFQWALIAAPEGSAATLAGAATATPSFTADLPGVYVAQLVVTDDDVAPLVSDPDTVVIAIVNAAPIADAGPDRRVAIPRDRLVQLAGGGSSDPDGDPLSFAWSFADKPAGSTAALSDPAAENPSFVADLAGDYVVQLIVNDGIQDSDPDLATVTADANRPIADAGPDQAVTAGALVTLDGSASSDPEGAPLTYGWRFLFTPAGSTASLSDPTAVGPSFTADLAGLYIVELTVNDGAFDSQPATVAVRAGSGATNAPPVLAAIGPQSVALGSTLTLALTGSDPDGDTIFYRATPVPLPAGASLATLPGAAAGDPNVGRFRFTPSPAQVGAIVITFSVSDGLASASESVTITVTGAPVGGVTAFTGQVLDANAKALGQDLPLNGATVCLLDRATGLCGAVTSISDALGDFTLDNVPDGDQVVVIDGSTAVAAPDGSPYGSLRDNVRLFAQVSNRPADPFLVPRVDVTSLTTVTPAVTTVVENSTLGVTLTIPPNSAFNPDGSLYTGQLSISDVPPDQIAGLLPPFISPCQVVSIEPFGITLGLRTKISLPNRDNLSPGSQADIWVLDPATGEFRILDLGQVTTDGLRVESLVGVSLTRGVPVSSMLFAVPVAPVIGLAADHNAANVTPTALADGNLSQRVTLPSYRSFGEDRALSFVYNSAVADPRPVVAAEITFQARTDLPPLLELALEVGGIEVAGPVVMSTSDPAPLPETANQTIRQAISFDAGLLPSGNHPARLAATAKYACSKVGAVARDRVAVNNQEASAFGAGWTLDGLQRLTVQDDGRVLLEEGDGSTLTFDPAPSGTAFRERLAFPVEVPHKGTLDDFDGNGKLDIAIAAVGSGDIDVLLGDGGGGFPLFRALPIAAPVDVSDPFLFIPDAVEVASGDFDEDGIRDVAVAVQDTGRVRVRFGNGDGSFGGDLAFSLTFPLAIAVADFDLDGHDDMAVGFPGSGANRVRVYFGNGTGAFPVIRDFGTGLGIRDIEVDDFNNDGLPDMAVAAARNGVITVLTNNGAGGFARADLPVGGLDDNIHQALASGDLNGDGFADLAVTQPAVAPAANLKVVFNNGAGGFLPPITVPLGFQPFAVAIADMDADGTGDLVAAGRLQGKLAILLADGAGGFQAPVEVAVGAPPLYPLHLADLNGDRALDIVTGSASENLMLVLLAETSGAERFQRPPGDFSVLAERPQGGFTRSLPDGTVFEFDATGRQTTRIDRNGNATRYFYDAENRLAKQADPSAGAPGEPACNTRGVTCYVYAGGLLETVIDPTGRVTRYAYDANNNLTDITQVDASVRRLAYDENKRLISEVSERGFVTTHSYGFAGQWFGSGFPDGSSITAQISNSLGLADLNIGLGTVTNPAPYGRPANQMAEFTDGRGNTTSIKLNEFGEPVEITDALGKKTTLERNEDSRITRVTATSDGELPDGSNPGVVVTQLDYDERGNVVSQREAVGTSLERVTTFEYEPVFNQLKRVVGPDGNPTTFDYDIFGNLTKATDAVGGEQTFTYDEMALQTSFTNESTDTTTYTYDASGNRETIGYADQTLTRIARDEAGQIEALINAEGSAEERTISFTYDTRGRVTSRTDGAGGTVSYTYDATGNIVSFVNEAGDETTVTYDEMDRLASVSSADAGTFTVTRDPVGNVTELSNSLTGPSGAATRYEYSDLNLLIQSEDALGHIQTFDYDVRGNLIGLTDANTNATTFAHDVFDRTIRRTNAVGDTYRYTYDPEDNVVQVIDPKDQVSTATYDALSKLTGVTAGDNVMSYTYDVAGNLTSASDDDSALAFTHDKLKRAVQVETLSTGIQPPVVLTNTYGPRGNRLSLSSSLGDNWGFSDDLAGRMTTVTPPTGGAVGIDYRSTGQLAGLVFPNGTAEENLFDPLTGRLAQLSHMRGVSPFVSNEYAYDAAGNVTSIAGLGGPSSFQYDLIEQLVASDTPAGAESYDYDGEGNRIESHLSFNHDVDAANRLLEDDSFCYTYDLNGNLATKTEKESGLCTGLMTTAYTYNAQNQLIRIDLLGGAFASYRYDAFGRRIEKNVNGAVTRFLYDRLNLLAEFDGAGNLVARYTHGPFVDQPLEMQRGGQNYYFHADHIGSIVALTNSAGAVVNEYAYDAYGNFTRRLETVQNPYAFTGRYYDAESGLYYYRARYYDPNAGRFITEDPLNFGASDTNFYRYVRNNPANLKDPLGLSPQSEERAVLGVAVAASPGFISLGNALEFVFGFIAGILAAASIDASDGDCDLCPSSGGNGDSGGEGGKNPGGPPGGNPGGGGNNPGKGHNNPPPDNPWPIAVPPDWFSDTDWPGWSPGEPRDPWGNAVDHWDRHGPEFPELETIDDYVKAANDFIANPPEGTLTRPGPKGDEWYYDRATNTFVIESPSGVPKTMFKPDDGILYFLKPF